MNLTKIFSYIRAAAILALAAIPAGCGGGGGTAQSPSSPASAGYVTINRASADVGTALVQITYGDVTLLAALPSSRKVTITERFYTGERPRAAIGKIYDIQPDNLPFLSGTKLCISIPGNYPADSLVIATGAALDQPVPGSAPSGRQVCAPLTHSSPYSLTLVENLKTLEVSTFGGLTEKHRNDYKYKAATRTENNEQWGTMFIVNIKVFCDLECINDGEREFSFMAGKADQNGVFDPLPDDLFIRDNGAYQLWKDMNMVPWTHLRSSDGQVVGGIAYLLAAEYAKFYLGGDGKMDDYISELDPKEISIQRFVYDNGPRHQTNYIEIIRSEKDMPGILKVFIREASARDGKTYLINKTTAAITKKWITAENKESVQTAAPGETGYDALNSEALGIVKIIVGLNDTPDETRGNSGDNIPRMSPAQELFAVNTMNLLRGYGWKNLVEIETYYRSRLTT